MSYQDLQYSVEGKVATIALNRPDRMNALSRNLEAEIHRALDEADADRNVRAIILAGFLCRLRSGRGAGFRRSPLRSQGQNPRRVHRILAAPRWQPRQQLDAHVGPR
jgi:plasmid stabilization system protein ParE